VYALQRNPFFPKYFLSIGDWTARVWMEDIKTPVMTTKYHDTYLMGGVWSPTRPGVFSTIKVRCRCCPNCSQSPRRLLASSGPQTRVAVCGSNGSILSHATAQMNHTLAHQAAFHQHSIGAPFSNPLLRGIPEFTRERCEGFKGPLCRRPRRSGG